jgi:hypothetical protein
VEERYSWDRIVGSLTDLYRAVAAGRSPAAVSDGTDPAQRDALAGSN